MDFLLWFAIFTTLETVNWLALSVLNSIKYNQVSWEEKNCSNSRLHRKFMRKWHIIYIKVTFYPTREWSEARKIFSVPFTVDTWYLKPLEIRSTFSNVLEIQTFESIGSNFWVDSVFFQYFIDVNTQTVILFGFASGSILFIHFQRTWKKV